MNRIGFAAQIVNMGAPAAAAVGSLPFARNPAIMEAMASLGRGGDNMVGHLTKGEIIIPVGMQNEDVMAQLAALFEEHGRDLGRFTVGGPDDSRNPSTGWSEFFDGQESGSADGTGSGGDPSASSDGGAGGGYSGGYGGAESSDNAASASATAGDPGGPGSGDPASDPLGTPQSDPAPGVQGPGSGDPASDPLGAPQADPVAGDPGGPGSGDPDSDPLGAPQDAPDPGIPGPGTGDPASDPLSGTPPGANPLDGPGGVQNPEGTWGSLAGASQPAGTRGPTDPDAIGAVLENAALAGTPAAVPSPATAEQPAAPAVPGSALQWGDFSLPNELSFAGRVVSGIMGAIGLATGMPLGSITSGVIGNAGYNTAVAGLQAAGIDTSGMSRASAIANAVSMGIFGESARSQLEAALRENPNATIAAMIEAWATGYTEPAGDSIGTGGADGGTGGSTGLMRPGPVQTALTGPPPPPPPPATNIPTPGGPGNVAPGNFFGSQFLANIGAAGGFYQNLPGGVNYLAKVRDRREGTEQFAPIDTWAWNNSDTRSPGGWGSVILV